MIDNVIQLLIANEKSNIFMLDDLLGNEKFIIWQKFSD